MLKCYQSLLLGCEVLSYFYFFFKLFFCVYTVTPLAFIIRKENVLLLSFI